METAKGKVKIKKKKNWRQSLFFHSVDRSPF